VDFHNFGLFDGSEQSQAYHYPLLWDLIKWIFAVSEDVVFSFHVDFHHFSILKLLDHFSHTNHTLVPGKRRRVTPQLFQKRSFLKRY